MSSISGIAANAPDLYQIMQSVTNGSSPSTAQAGSPSTDPTATDTAAAPAKGHHHHGHHGGGGAASKIESSVTAALQNAPDGSDPNQVVKDAITQALQQNGSDPTAANAAGNGSAAAGSSPAASPNSPADFAKLLSSYGVDSQQFEQDLQASLPADGSGSPNFSTLLKSFPPGSLIQTTG